MASMKHTLIIWMLAVNEDGADPGWGREDQSGMVADRHVSNQRTQSVT
jgi:hypothetical protein